MFTPINPNASKEVKDLLNYLESIQGNGILTGQHTQTIEQKELSHIEQKTGKLPAICGFELLAYSPNIRYETCDEVCLKEVYENRDTLKKAYEWAARGGIVTFTWHWYSPIGGHDKSFYTEKTDFDASLVLVEGTPEREAFYHDMDVMAELLRGFQEKRIPILWRPFHEANGKWFWWGAKGQEVVRELYRLMYHYFTDVKRLNNLIWVWNNDVKEGYVGDEYCDILSADYYPPAYNHTPLKEQYNLLRSISSTKPLAIGEIGPLPDISAMKEAGTDWLWFMMWSNDFACTDRFTTDETFKEQYSHPYAINLEQLKKRLA